MKNRYTYICVCVCVCVYNKLTSLQRNMCKWLFSLKMLPLWEDVL